MNSSPQDLDAAAGDSPAPPAISPLTDPADPGNREPFPPVDVDLALDNSGPDQNHAAALPNDATDLSRPSSNDALLNHTHNHNLAPDAPMADLQQLPVTSYFPEPLDGFADPLRDNTYASWNGRANGNVYEPPMYPMTLADFSHPHGPNMTTVHPSLISSRAHGNMAGVSLSAQDPDRSLESFARIEFADSVFQMTTYAVIIGRDQNALMAAKRDKRRADEHQVRVNEARARGLPDPPAPVFGTLNKFSKSYVSNEGGMLGPESDGDGDSQDRRPGRRRKRALSDSAGHPVVEEPAAADAPAQDDPNVISERQYVSHTPGAVAVNVAALRPSPYEIPFIGIHSPHPNVIAGTKGISRQHLKIQFSSERGVFEAHPLHKNGFFVGDTFYKDQKVPLRSGDMIQIKDVTFNFIINGVPRGKTGAEEYVEESEPETAQGTHSEGPKAMSLVFENRDQGRKSTSVEPEDVPMEDRPSPEPETPLPKPAVPKGRTQSDASSSGGAMEADQDASGVMETIEDDDDDDAEGEEHQDSHTKPREAIDLAAMLGIDGMAPMKKRGPGRPPKNGIMSKREERVLRKLAEAEAKANMPQPPAGEPPVKRKVGRPRKHPLPDAADGEREPKRRYKPRKKNGEEGVESDGERIDKQKRREKPKTPPLELDRNNYTEEQLQKPNKNYGILIDEILTAALPDGLTLKQIYKRIQMRWPFYYFTVDTKGWESSVRHNLIGNEAFTKNEETHLWRRVPGIGIEAGKKRSLKGLSPDNAGNSQNFNQQHATPASYGAAPTYPQSAGAPPAGYPSGPTTGVPGQPLQQHPGGVPAGVPLQPPRQPYPTQGQVPATQPPAYQQAAAGRPPHGVAPVPSYSAPHPTANAPIAMAAQPGATPHSMARQYTQPPHGSAVANGMPPAPRTHPAAAPVAQPVARPPQQPAAPISAPLKPAVAPELVKHVVKFKATARESLVKLSPTPDAIAAAAVHRALGLTTRALEPSDESLVKIIMGVFETSRKHLTEREGVRAELTVLHPDLLQTLLNFKDRISQTIEKTVGPIKGEQLILSAVDRALGFSDRSNMAGNPDQMNEINRAEDVLIPAISTMVVEHQRRVANAALKATTPVSTASYQAAPVPAGAGAYRPTAPGPAASVQRTPVPTHAPPSSSATPAMYRSAATPAAAARPAGAYPPRPPAQAANAHVQHAPAAPPAAYRPSQSAASNNSTVSQPPNGSASALAKSSSAPTTPALSSSAPSAVPRTSAPPSVPAAPLAYTPQNSFTPAARAAPPNPAAQSSRPMAPSTGSPLNPARAPTATTSAAPMSAANPPPAAAPQPRTMPAVAPPAPMMPSVPPPTAAAPAPAPTPVGPATTHALTSMASPPLPRAAAPPVSTPSLSTVTTAP
ncbi:hypothetical protein QBC39DRAFT_339353 [Podospora conica]|nr:hypothetical protein QBC39DRAFT_339353 [Schizothecium conicum]